MEPVPDGARLSFSNFAHLGQESFYWQLPETYQGDKVAAYGGKLRYTLSYTSGPQGSPLSDPDIQITGNNIMLVASQPALQGPERRSYEIIFREEFWRRPDGQPATREHLLMALADLDELLVRATFSSVPRAASISAVSLEVAQPGPLVDPEPSRWKSVAAPQAMLAYPARTVPPATLALGADCTLASASCANAMATPKCVTRRLEPARVVSTTLWVSSVRRAQLATTEMPRLGRLRTASPVPAH